MKYLQLFVAILLFSVILGSNVFAQNQDSKSYDSPAGKTCDWECATTNSVLPLENEYNSNPGSDIVVESCGSGCIQYIDLNHPRTVEVVNSEVEDQNAKFEAKSWLWAFGICDIQVKDRVKLGWTQEQNSLNELGECVRAIGTSSTVWSGHHSMANTDHVQDYILKYSTKNK